jgi:hypothetical protein
MVVAGVTHHWQGPWHGSGELKVFWVIWVIRVEGAGTTTIAAAATAAAAATTMTATREAGCSNKGRRL